jgi:hypothetical protein
MISISYMNIYINKLILINLFYLIIQEANDYIINIFLYKLKI